MKLIHFIINQFFSNLGEICEDLKEKQSNKAVVSKERPAIAAAGAQPDSPAPRLLD